jgi:hypothetical protein
MFESHRHDYDEMLAREERQAGLPPKWIPLLVPLYALMLIGLVYFIVYEVL